MESGLPICALRASGHRISDSGSIGWPTPNAEHQNDTDSNWEERRAELKEKYGNNGFGMTLSIAAQQAGWATPQAADGGKIGSKPNFGQVGLSNHPALHGYPEREPMQKSREGDGQTTNLSGWNSPRATDGSNGGPNQSGGALSNDAAGSATPLGQTQSGSPSETGSKGVLNPALPLWMMGYPIYWVQCAPQKRGRKRKV